jgi:prefoldin subunit 5
MGSFTDEEFVVPALAAGVYYVVVADEYGAATNGSTVFTVTAAPTTSIALNAASYYTGDTLSFSITTTEATMSELTVTIYSPAGVVYWTADWSAALPATPVKRVLFMDQVVNGNPITIPADAPLGSWNWTIIYKPQSLAFASTKATGLFTVAAIPTMQTVLDAIDAMEATITDVITTSEGNIVAVINTKSGQIVADISDLDAKITSIDGAIVTLSTAVGEVQTTVSNLDMGTLGADITAIKGDVATIKTNLGTVDMAVDDLDAKVTDLADGIATVQTNLGTLQGTVTSIDNTVATINTGVGSLQADVSDVSAKADVTPVWIAVVLSLVAAIAAIFAVITIRQKIAG